MNIIRGKVAHAARRIIYGPAGCGKSTFGCSEPGAMALDYEDGVAYLGVDRVRGPKTWDESLALVREACGGPGDHKAVVVDTVDRLEAQLAEDICRKGIKGKAAKSLAEFGYGDGYKALAGRWRELLFELESARPKGRSVTLVAHAQRSKVSDPTLGDYARYIGTLHVDCWNTTAQWADAVLFANYEAGLADGRAIMTGARVLHTVAGTGYDAKHRPNLVPASMPLEWSVYARAVADAARAPEEIAAAIRAMAKTPELLAAAEERLKVAGADGPRLLAIESKLREKVGLTA
jgi:hypothetical protein